MSEICTGVKSDRFLLEQIGGILEQENVCDCLGFVFVVTGVSFNIIILEGVFGGGLGCGQTNLVWVLQGR